MCAIADHRIHCHLFTHQVTSVRLWSKTKHSCFSNETLTRLCMFGDDPSPWFGLNTQGLPSKDVGYLIFAKSLFASQVLQIFAASSFGTAVGTRPEAPI